MHEVAMRENERISNETDQKHLEIRNLKREREEKERLARDEKEKLINYNADLEKEIRKKNTELTRVREKTAEIELESRTRFGTIERKLEFANRKMRNSQSTIRDLEEQKSLLSREYDFRAAQFMRKLKLAACELRAIHLAKLSKPFEKEEVVRHMTSELARFKIEIENLGGIQKAENAVRELYDEKLKLAEQRCTRTERERDEMQKLLESGQTGDTQETLKKIKEESEQRLRDAENRAIDLEAEIKKLQMKIKNHEEALASSQKGRGQTEVELQQKITGLQERIADLEAQNKRLDDFSSGSSSKIADTVKESEAKRLELEEEIRKHKATISQLETECGKLKKGLADKGQATVGATSAAIKEKAQYESELTKLRAELDLVKREKEEVFSELKRKDEIVDTQSKEIENLNSALGSAGGEAVQMVKKELADQIEDLKGQLAKAGGGAIDELEEKLEDVEKENAKLQEDLDAAEDEIGKLEDEKAEIESEIRKVKDDLKAAEEEIEALEKELEEGAG